MRMDFRLLQMRLLGRLRTRVRNGEITERGLARITGVSQPHLHNVLKGVRVLSPDMADQILGRLRISLVDLLTPGEACRTIPLLDGWIGPQYPFPRATVQAGYPFRAADVDCLGSPVAACLAPDPHGEPPFHQGGIVLLECAEGPRLDPPEDGYVALDLAGGSAIARLRRTETGWGQWTHESGMWQPLANTGRDTLDLIKGRVRLLVRHF